MNVEDISADVLMKRFGNIWPLVCDKNNIKKAVLDVLHTTRSSLKRNIRRRGSSNVRQRIRLREMLSLEKNIDQYVSKYQDEFLMESYSFGKMIQAEVREPKLRKIDYPIHLRDRIYHHALMNIAGPLLISKMTADTYSSMKGRGILSLSKKLKYAISRHPDWYFVQTDFYHFYESIQHDILKEDLQRCFKDDKILRMFYKIIDNHQTGLAIGVSPSAYLANLYLSKLDHLLKEKERVPFVFRYMDDIVCLVPSKEDAHRIFRVIYNYGLSRGLKINNNWRISPVLVGIDICGYVFFPDHTLLRKSIKIRMKRSAKRNIKADDATFKRKLAPYFGWCKHADCRNLFKKVMADKIILFKDSLESSPSKKEGSKYKRLSEIKAENGTTNSWFGLSKNSRRSILDLLNKEIIFFEYMEVTVRGENKVAVCFAFPDRDEERLYFLTKSIVIKDRLEKEKDQLPFLATLKKENNYYCFE